jgi:ribonuclease HI
MNLDLWEKFDVVSKDIDIEWNWVKAHNGNEYNEIVDNIAREEAKRMKNLKYLV